MVYLKLGVSKNKMKQNWNKNAMKGNIQIQTHTDTQTKEEKKKNAKGNHLLAHKHTKNKVFNGAAITIN